MKETRLSMLLVDVRSTPHGWLHGCVPVAGLEGAFPVDREDREPVGCRSDLPDKAAADPPFCNGIRSERRSSITMQVQWSVWRGNIEEAPQGLLRRLK